MKKKKISGVLVISLAFLIIAGILVISHLKNDFIYHKDVELSKPAEQPFNKNGDLVFIKKGSKIPIKNIEIEIADNDVKRKEGLMWRTTITDNQGMLFTFEKEELLTFWMKNTSIPLDIIFIDKSMKIVNIRINNKPLNDKPIRSAKPAKYVVEVIAGFCYNYKIKVGDKVNYRKIEKF